MSRASQRLRRIFERRYHIVIAVLIVSVTFTFAVSFITATVQSDRTYALNLANGQKVLSQRIAFLINALDQGDRVGRVDALREELSITVTQMRVAHNTLTGQNAQSKPIRRFIKPIAPIYFGGAFPFDNRVRAFLESADEITGVDPLSVQWGESQAERDQIVRAATDNLLQTHDLITRVMEAEAERYVDHEKLLDVVFWVFTLALLGLITVLIFRPMSSEIQRAIEDVEGARSVARRAEEDAVAANEAKGHFFEAASHELKTPLNAILGLSDTLRSRNTDGVDVEIEQITAAGDHLLSLLNNILDTNRISEGSLTLAEETFRPAETIERSIRIGQQLAAEKGIKFETNIDVLDYIAIVGDPGRMEQVFVNLVDNAVKFTDHGKVSFDAHVATQDGNATLKVAVSDTGAGIAESEQATIFEKYSNAGGGRTSGLGVSLAMAKTLTELMGGGIDLHSVKGKGSRFLVQMPLTLVEMDALEDSAMMAESYNEVSRSFDKSTFDVLIVDDNLANRMVAEALVKPLGGVVTMAVDGRQAVAKAEAQCFDLILMDISMPVMDGIQATDAIRGGAGKSKTSPIVALSAHVDPSDPEGLKAQGFSDVLAKPIRKDVMDQCIDRWVSLEMTKRAKTP